MARSSMATFQKLVAQSTALVWLLATGGVAAECVPDVPAVCPDATHRTVLKSAGRVGFSCTRPTKRVDCSALDAGDIDAYRLLYGRNESTTDGVETVTGNPPSCAASFDVSQYNEGWLYAVIKTVDSDGKVSGPSCLQTLYLVDDLGQLIKMINPRLVRGAL